MDQEMKFVNWKQNKTKRETQRSKASLIFTSSNQNQIDIKLIHTLSKISKKAKYLTINNKYNKFKKPALKILILMNKDKILCH